MGLFDFVLEDFDMAELILYPSDLLSVDLRLTDLEAAFHDEQYHYEKAMYAPITRSRRNSRPVRRDDAPEPRGPRAIKPGRPPTPQFRRGLKCAVQRIFEDAAAGDQAA